MIKHGKSGTKTYSIWRQMKSRCSNPKHKSYSHYGGRGIKVSEDWLVYPNFLNDMGERPEGLDIDRIDNDKGYSKDNCRWTTRAINLSNKRVSGSSGFKGVFKNYNGFMARISINNKPYYIGTFPTPELASLAYETCKFVLNSSDANL